LLYITGEETNTLALFSLYACLNFINYAFYLLANLKFGNIYFKGDSANKEIINNNDNDLAHQSSNNFANCLKGVGKAPPLEKVMIP